MLKSLGVAALIAVAMCSSARAQVTTGNEFSTQQQGKPVPGTVQMCLNSSGVAVPVSNGTCAGGSSETVTANQGAAGSAAWPVSTVPSNSGTINVACTALCSSLLVPAAPVPASLYSFTVSADSTLSGAAWWIMIFNSTTNPTAGGGAVTPARCIAMASGSTAYTGAFPVGLPFGTGIVIGTSTTGCFTYTQAAAHAYIAGDYK